MKGDWSSRNVYNGDDKKEMRNGTGGKTPVAINYQPKIYIFHIRKKNVYTISTWAESQCVCRSFQSVDDSLPRHQRHGISQQHTRSSLSTLYTYICIYLFIYKQAVSI